MSDRCAPDPQSLTLQAIPPVGVAPAVDFVAPVDLVPGQRWSTWDDIGVLAGPRPWPDWVVTADAAVDTELGILKTGKEADVFLVERATTEQSCVLAAKRYRSHEQRLFHRDSAFNILAAEERIVIIDVPQAVDIVANPQGMDYLARDCRNVCTWFGARGRRADPDGLLGDLVARAW